MKIGLAFVCVLLISAGAFAQKDLAPHGVEKVLPSDAHNPRLLSWDIGYAATGSHAVGRPDNEGQRFELDYDTNPRLTLVVAFDSADRSTVPMYDGSYTSREESVPQEMFTFTISPALAKDILHKKVKVPSLITVLQLTPKAVTLYKDHEAQCRYDWDSNRKLDDNCQEPASTPYQGIRPVLEVGITGAT